MSDAVLVALVGAVPTTLIGIAALVKAAKISKQIDGRLSELLAITKKAAHAEGVKDEKDNPTK